MTHSIHAEGAATPAAQMLREYGQAMRGDWSEIDGRSVRLDLNLIAAWVDGTNDYPGDLEARQSLCICPLGHGHWEYHCAGYKCGEGEDEDEETDLPADLSLSERNRRRARR